MASKSKKRAQKRAPRGSPLERRHVTTPRPRPVVAPKLRAPARKPARSLLVSSPRRLYAVALGIAVLLGALLIGLGQVSAHRGTAATPQSSGGEVFGAAGAAALLDGIPQRGNVLGYATAPVRLVEYADPQCPYCAQYARDVLPTLIRDYVRTGKVQLEYRGLWFLGPDSGTALRTATAAGAQHRFWNVMELLYRNQGPENAWVNDGLLRSIVTAADADANRVFAARDGATVAAAIDGWARQGRADRVNGVPAFFVGRRGAAPEPLPVTALAVPQFRAELDGALR